MCYFLQYGKFMRLLRFDRASLAVSEIVDIKKVSLLLAVGILKKNPTSSPWKDAPYYGDSRLVTLPGSSGCRSVPRSCC